MELWEMFKKYLLEIGSFGTIVVILILFLKTKHGCRFLEYIGSQFAQGVLKKVDKIDIRVVDLEKWKVNVDKRLDKGDDKFKELAKDIKAGDLSNREQLNQINNNVNMILEILIKGKED